MPVKNSLAASKEVRSIQELSQLRHPNLVRIDNVWIQPGFIVLGMELADGSLLDLFEAYQTEYQIPINPEQVCMYLRQAAEALDFLNSRQHLKEGRRVSYIHCDVKPNNMLLTGSVLKLADYGLATPITSALAGFTSSGTIDFAAPEVFT